MRDFAFTAAHQRQVIPRRGTLGSRSFTPGPRARTMVSEELQAHLEEITQRLDSSPEADLRVAGREWLDGAAGARPVGAAAVALVALERWDIDWRKAPFADAWIAERGLRFAAEAAVEGFGLTVGPSDVQRLAPWASLHTWWLSPQVHLAMRVRTALATAPTAEYAEIVAVLAGYRSGHSYHRLATSLLAPTEPGWVEADIADALVAPDQFRAYTLLQAAGSREQLERLDTVRSHHSPLGSRHGSAATVLDGVGAEALGVFLRWLDEENLDTADRRELLGVIAQIPGEQAVRALAGRADQRLVPAALLEALSRHPQTALRVLAEVAGPRGPLAEMLSAHVLGHRELAAESLAGLPTGPAARIRGILAGAVAVVEAPPEAVPPVLLSPPWQNPAKPAKPIVIPGLTCTDEVTVEWAEGEREGLAELYDAGLAQSVEKNWEQLAEKVTDDGGSWFSPVVFFVEAPAERAQPLLAAWVPHEYVDADGLGPVAARFGVEALPSVLRRARPSPLSVEPVLAPYSSPELAVQMADWLSRLKSAWAMAVTWLLRHPAEASRALVPPALGKAGPARRQAENALREIAGNGLGEQVRRAAQSYGPEAAAAIEVLLAERDPLSLRPARIPVAPSWAAPAQLPPVRVRSGAGVLPPSAVQNLVTVFMLSGTGAPYAALESVREAVNPGDLADFAWSLFQGWSSAGAVPKEGWAFEALALAGDDEAVRRLTPLILAWPGEGGHARAVTGVNILAAIGTDTALHHLNRISQRAKFRGLKTAAQEMMAVVAEGLGLTADQLADRLVPELGLKPDGSLTLDYGPRQFAVGFDEHLRPFVADGAGKRLKSLPKPGAKDDPSLAPAAYQQFSALKKEVRVVAADAVQRLESAMVTGRRWSGTEFRQLLVGHPLLQHIVRRLVWGLYTAQGALTGAVRVAEDGTFADVHDGTVSVPDDAIVGVVHPVQLAEATAAWSEVFADHEILQPLGQLGRPVFTLAPGEAEASSLVRFEGVKVATTKLLGLDRRGWRRVAAVDSGIQDRIERSIGTGPECVIDLDPGILIGDPAEWAQQRLSSVYLHDGNNWAAGFGETRIPLSTLDPIAVSELLRDLTEVTTVS